MEEYKSPRHGSKMSSKGTPKSKEFEKLKKKRVSEGSAPLSSEGSGEQLSSEAEGEQKYAKAVVQKPSSTSTKKKISSKGKLIPSEEEFEERKYSKGQKGRKQGKAKSKQHISKEADDSAIPEGEYTPSRHGEDQEYSPYEAEGEGGVYDYESVKSGRKPSKHSLKKSVGGTKGSHKESYHEEEGKHDKYAPTSREQLRDEEQEYEQEKLKGKVPTSRKEYRESEASERSSHASKGSEKQSSKKGKPKSKGRRGKQPIHPARPYAEEGEGSSPYEEYEEEKLSPTGSPHGDEDVEDIARKGKVKDDDLSIPKDVKTKEALPHSPHAKALEGEGEFEGEHEAGFEAISGKGKSSVSKGTLKKRKGKSQGQKLSKIKGETKPHVEGEEEAKGIKRQGRSYEQEEGELESEELSAEAEDRHRPGKEPVKGKVKGKMSKEEAKYVSKKGDKSGPMVETEQQYAESQTPKGSDFKRPDVTDISKHSHEKGILGEEIEKERRKQFIKEGEEEEMKESRSPSKAQTTKGKKGKATKPVKGQMKTGKASGRTIEGEEMEGEYSPEGSEEKHKGKRKSPSKSKQGKKGGKGKVSGKHEKYLEASEAKEQEPEKVTIKGEGKKTTKPKEKVAVKDEGKGPSSSSSDEESKRKPGKKGDKKAPGKPKEGEKKVSKRPSDEYSDEFEHKEAEKHLRESEEPQGIKERYQPQTHEEYEHRPHMEGATDEYGRPLAGYEEAHEAAEGAHVDPHTFSDKRLKVITPGKEGETFGGAFSPQPPAEEIHEEDKAGISGQKYTERSGLKQRYADLEDEGDSYRDKEGRVATPGQQRKLLEEEKMRALEPSEQQLKQEGRRPSETEYYTEGKTGPVRRKGELETAGLGEPDKEDVEYISQAEREAAERQKMGAKGKRYGRKDEEHFDEASRQPQRDSDRLRGECEDVEETKGVTKEGQSYPSREEAEISGEKDMHKRPHKDQVEMYEQEAPGHYTGGIQGHREGQTEEASFEAEGTIDSKHPQNLFLPGHSEEVEDDEITPLPEDFSKVRQQTEGDSTGKFGGSHPYKFGESLSGRKHPVVSSKEERENYIKSQAESNRKSRLKKYLSGEPGKEDTEHISGSSLPQRQKDRITGRFRNEPTEEGKYTYGGSYPLSQSKGKIDNKSLHSNLFEGKESRIESQEHTMDHGRRAGDRPSFEVNDSRSNLFNTGNYKMMDDSFNEIDQINNRIPEYDQNQSMTGAKGHHKLSLDSEGQEFTNFKRDLNRPLEYNQQMDDGHHSAFKGRMKASNSQFIDPNYKDPEFRRLAEKNLHTDVKRRGYSNNLGEHLYYPPESSYYQQYADETGLSLDLDYTLLDPHEPLLLDHGIMKFHPGFSVNYVSRWVQVTKTVIRFYKNYYHSVCSFRRPLAAIPLSAISKVKNFKLVPKVSGAQKILNRGKNPYDQNQFEIVLKEDYEAIYDLNKRKKELEDLKYELDLIHKLDYQNRLTNKYKRYRRKCKLSKSPVPTFRDFMENQQDEIKKLSQSHPRLSVYSKLYDDDISDNYDVRTNKTHNFDRDHSMISRGRQSRMEASGDRSVISVDEQYIHNSASRSRSRTRTKNKIHMSEGRSQFKKRSKTPFDSTMIVDGHLMPIRVNKQERNGTSTFRKPAKKKKPRVHWSKREADWFKFERRFILAAKSKKEKKKWMKALKKLIPK